MPKLLSRFKHKEFESNSALQIRDQKERKAENTKKIEHKKIFAGLRNLLPTRTVHIMPLFTSPATVPSCCPFDLLTVASFFVFFPFYPL